MIIYNKMKKVILFLALMITTFYSFGQVYDILMIKNRFDEFIKNTPREVKTIINLNNYESSPNMYSIIIETKGENKVYFSGIKTDETNLGSKDSPIDVTGQGVFGYEEHYGGFIINDTSIENIVSLYVNNELTEKNVVVIIHRTIVERYSHNYKADMWIMCKQDGSCVIYYRNK